MWLKAEAADAKDGESGGGVGSPKLEVGGTHEMPDTERFCASTSRPRAFLSLCIAITGSRPGSLMYLLRLLTAGRLPFVSILASGGMSIEYSWASLFQAWLLA